MDEDRLSASSAESDNDNDNENEIGQDIDNDNDADDVMEDADETGDNDADGDDDGDGDGDGDNNDDDEEEEGGDNDAEGEDDAEGEGDGNAVEGRQDTSDVNGDATTAVKPSQSTDGAQDGEESQRQRTASPKPPIPNNLRPRPRPEIMTARVYDIVPTMAAPQSTSVNAMAITPDLRYWITGGSDGYIRKYDGPGTINGRLALTVAQRHPFVDSVVKAGILMSYWENEEPAPQGKGEEHILSPVYSLALHSQALWLLSGLESGGINLQSVRHDEGKRITCLQQHTNAVSVLTLAQDEKSVLSGSWDKNIIDWDLNTGNVARTFDGMGGQISAIELRPASGAPIPEYADEPIISTTMTTNNDLPPVDVPTTNGVNGDIFGDASHDDVAPVEQGQASPAHESLFGGSDAGSLFGETSGGNAFGNDEDEYNAGDMGMMAGHEHEGGMDHSADMAMASLAETKEPEVEAAEAPAVDGDAMDVDVETQGVESEPAFPPSQDVPESQPPAPADSQAEVDPADIAALKRSQSPLTLTNEPPTNHDPTQMSATTFLSATIDGTLRIWDKRMVGPAARIGMRNGVPPWCMGACWSPDGNMIYAGRRNGTVEEFDIRNARRGWEPERTLRFPNGSGAVSAVRPMMNGRHLVW